MRRYFWCGCPRRQSNATRSPSRTDRRMLPGTPHGADDDSVTVTDHAPPGPRQLHERRARSVFSQERPDLEEPTT